MSDKPAVFTEAEQLRIRELERSGNDFLNYKNLILQTNFLGDRAPTVIGLANFLEGLITQTRQQLAGIQEEAQKRANSSVLPSIIENTIEPKKESNGKKTR